MADAHPVCEDIKELRILPFYNSDSTIDNLKREMPLMYAAEADVFSQIDRTDWWGKKADKLPEWSNACRKALLL